MPPAAAAARGGSWASAGTADDSAKVGHGIRRARIRKKVDAPSATGGVLDDGSVLHRRRCTERLRCALGHACALGERVLWHEDDDCEHQTIETQPFAHEDVLSRSHSQSAVEGDGEASLCGRAGHAAGDPDRSLAPLPFVHPNRCACGCGAWAYTDGLQSGRHLHASGCEGQRPYREASAPHGSASVAPTAGRNGANSEQNAALAAHRWSARAVVIVRCRRTTVSRPESVLELGQWQRPLREVSRPSESAGVSARQSRRSRAVRRWRRGATRVRPRMRRPVDAARAPPARSRVARRCPVRE